MKKLLEIKIDGTSYQMKFGYGAVRALGGYIGVETYDGTLKRVTELLQGLSDQENGNGLLSFDMLETLAYLIIGGIDCARQNEGHALNVDDVIDHVLNNLPELVPVVDAFVASMPKPEEKPKKKGNPTAPKRGGRSAKN